MLTNSYVLITHSGRHGAVAAYMVGDLERRGVRAVLRPPAEGEAQLALQNAGALIALVGDEMDAGTAQGDAGRIAQAGKPVYAVRLSEHAGAGLAGIQARQWIDAFGANAQANVARLADELRSVMQRPAPHAAQPHQHAPYGAPVGQPPQPAPNWVPMGQSPQRAPQVPPVGQPPQQARHAPPMAQLPEPAPNWVPIGQPAQQAPHSPPMGQQPSAAPIGQPPQRAPHSPPVGQPPQQARHAAAAPVAQPPRQAPQGAPVAQPPQPAPSAGSAGQPSHHASASIRSSRPDIKSFETKRCEPGESVLAWIDADQADATGIAILTDRRMCFYGRGDAGVRLESISVQTAQLRYNPEPGADGFDARFETENGAIEFTVQTELADSQLGNFLGNLKDLREAQAALRDAGYSGSAAQDAPGPEYRLMRLRELLNQGILSPPEYEAQRASMVAAICAGR